MEVYERRLETLAGQLAQVALNPTSGDLDGQDAFSMAEEGVYAVALPEKLDGDGSWDVYR